MRGRGGRESEIDRRQKARHHDSEDPGRKVTSCRGDRQNVRHRRPIELRWLDALSAMDWRLHRAGSENETRLRPPAQSTMT